MLTSEKVRSVVGLSDPLFYLAQHLEDHEKGEFINDPQEIIRSLRGTIFGLQVKLNTIKQTLKGVNTT